MRKLPIIMVMTAFVLVIAVLAVLGVLQRTQMATNKLQVVAAENFYGNIAQQIGGNFVQVTSVMSDPTADPHLYESNAADAAHVAHAAVIIKNGLGYDDFMNGLLSNATAVNRQVLTAASVVHAASNANPHLWYNVAYVQQVAAALAQAFEAKDPQHKTNYADNLTTFINALQPLTAKLASIKATHAGASAAYTERVPEYMLQAAGLVNRTPASFAAAVEDGESPSVADQQTMQQLITGKKIRVLLYNTQATSAVTAQLRALATQYNVPVVGVSETPPPGQTYQQWQLDQINSVATALGK